MSAAAVAPRRPLRWSATAGWTGFRVLLIAAWVVIAGIAVTTGQRISSPDRLEADVAVGRVHTVQVSGGLDGGGGFAALDVVWTSGHLTRRTEVVEVGPGVTGPADSRPVYRGDFVQHLEHVRPGLRVVPVVEPSSWSSILGWRTSIPVGLAILLVGLAQWSLVISGPEPLRATRWGWFWLSTTPLTTLACLVLSGPLRFVPAPRPDRRRLGGGWGFAIGAVLTAWTWSHLQ